jgi:Helix-turn-helix domain
MTEIEPFVGADEAGKFLQLHRRRVLQLARQGKLPAYPIGEGPRRVWRFRLSELASAMLDSRQRSHVPEGY